MNKLEKDFIACGDTETTEKVKACNCGGNCNCNNDTTKECACENVEEKSKITAKNNIILQRLAKPTVYKLTRIY